MPEPIQLDAIPAQYRGADHLQGMVHNKLLSEEQKIKEAATQFEAIMLRQILKDSMKPMFNGFLQGDTPGKDIYQQMMIDGLADTLARNKALGLADELARQITPMALPDGAVTPTGKPDSEAETTLNELSSATPEATSETAPPAMAAAPEPVENTATNASEAMASDIRQAMRTPFK